MFCCFRTLPDKDLDWQSTPSTEGLVKFESYNCGPSYNLSKVMRLIYLLLNEESLCTPVGLKIE